MTTTTRRKLIAGAAALPLLPTAALAVPVTLPLLPVSAFAAPADPVVTAFSEWRALDRERERVTAVFDALEAQHGPFTEPTKAYEAKTVTPLYARISAVAHRMAEMIATTPAGLAWQVRIAMEQFGYDNGFGMEEMEGRLLRSMLAGAEECERLRADNAA